MSKQSDAKQQQGYQPKPPLPVCGTCKQFRSDIVKQGDYGYELETNMRCDIGGFAVKKMGSCKRHEFREVV